MSGQKIGAMIAAIAGLVFIVINVGTLPAGIAVALRGLGVVAFIAVMTLSVLRRRPTGPAPVIDARAWHLLVDGRPRGDSDSTAETRVPRELAELRPQIWPAMVRDEVGGRIGVAA